MERHTHIDTQRERDRYLGSKRRVTVAGLEWQGSRKDELEGHMGHMNRALSDEDTVRQKGMGSEREGQISPTLE